ncbi:tetratricopeptide repeat protein [Alicyclobacillus fodiniaquatilis]|jgi:transcriptional regulator with XRE-family HTH domain|uniref:Tetratricopeptide repeat protein n=1 Tax=Alicyclobacillus fodiniaquatilis TaxID=1661150 RepID=A0ABW4JIR9_9BACL
MDTLGKKIRTLRRKQKLTQQTLAEGLVTASMISQIEADRATPSESLLQQIAKRLGVEVSYFASDLLDKSDEMQTYRQARHLMGEHRYKEAIDLLNTLSWPLSPQFKAEVVFNEMANCYLQMGQLHDAARMYECVIQAGYEKNDVATAIHGYYNVGNTKRRLGEERVACMYWQRAGDLLRQYDNMYMPIGLKIQANLGRLYLQEGNWVQARRAYEEALRLTNKYGGNLDLAKIYQGLAYACMKIGEFDVALEYNMLAIDAHTDAKNVKDVLKCQVNHGMILRTAGRYAEAQQHLLALRQHLSNDEDIVALAIAHELALVASALQDFDGTLAETETALTHALLNEQIEGEIRLLRAKTYVELGALETALREVEQGRACLTDNHSTALTIAFRDVERQCWMQSGRESDIIATCVAEAQRILGAQPNQCDQNISA